ncbi:MAG TPA: hypothetical protein PK331_17775 [Gordonia sp. (in: high G+C Gram-positive bacteria)]|uniref:hypothetical protein n=1 Tax=unclassified Gordonia (in: high G+C Gram-positive bacteria) TaxID=2657482 RepID=UPI000FBB40CF|nr:MULTISPECIES: hypothetical protein [unclassified Gordonia (in: high G+C Gram-positive bacteria)]RUP40145.1 MAG: hypothetical protein EKK60_04505 [Gordonia sp. (in: high G+C Gram-positive bacteria)]HNP59046.1 hypothetical protein [Gordonia sp. (in: high G+C Gram-positive bacteria)]HRC52755.1 hypothetical protein [Gordonia sp. (in: high G+C Gram-positive bacteria)]
MTNAQPAPGAPKPGQHLSPSASGAPAQVTPSDVADAITEMLEKLDEVSRQVAEGDDGSPVSAEKLAALDRQADLLERAHRVLADALAAIDHA